MSGDEIRRAAVALVVRPTDGRILVVWNRRYGGWALPGGKVEDGETPEQAIARELSEETSLALIGTPELIHEGPHNFKVESTRGSRVCVFRVRYWRGVPVEMEPGCPVTWFMVDDFLRWSPFATFYAPIFTEASK